jgi:hypothetical protein
MKKNSLFLHKEPELTRWDSGLTSILADKFSLGSSELTRPPFEITDQLSLGKLS